MEKGCAVRPRAGGIPWISWQDLTRPMPVPARGELPVSHVPAAAGMSISVGLAPLACQHRYGLRNLAGRRVQMSKHCPSCGVTVADQIRCPLCDASLVKVNLRRVLLWAIVMEEYFLLSVAIVRRGLSLL